VTRVLVVSYYFPPIGGAGAQRPAAFVRYLHEAGYEPVVITGPGSTVGRWTPQDATLSSDLPRTVDIRRTPPEPFVPQWQARAERWLWAGDEWSSWWVDQCVALSRDLDVDVIYALMSPYASAEAGSQLSRVLGKPWIADLGDPWALDEMMIYPTWIHRRRELTRMRGLLGTASGIVLTTGEAVRRVRASFPELADRQIVSIPCGFDRHDLEGPVAPRTDDAFRIVHTGYLHTELGRQQRRQAAFHKILGGGIRNVDILTRSHLYLLEAVERLRSRDQEAKARLEVHLAGVLSAADRSSAQLSDAVRLYGYVSHAPALDLMRSADLLFLPLQNLPPGMPSATVPGKTYEYLATGRPILGAVPEGDAREILLASGLAQVCRPDDIEGLAAAIGRRLHDVGPAPTATPGFTDQFEYQNLTKHVAGLIDDVTGTRTRTQGTDRLRRSLSSAAPRITALRGDARAGYRNRRGRVLLLAYYFPPIGGAGAQRSVKLARYLPELGWDVTVVTGTGSVSGRWAPIDESLLGELSETIHVERIQSPEPGQPDRWRSRVERWGRVDSEWSKWWEEGLVKRGLALEDEVDVIVASMSPYNTARAAVELSEKLGKPWVAGLRDPWALDEMMIYPSGVHRRLEAAEMRRMLRNAAATVTTTPESARRVRATFPELAAKPVVSIPNGFDRTDFEGVAERPRDDVFRILHSGYLHTDIGRRWRSAQWGRRALGGASPGTDILTRSHLYLLRAIEMVLKRNPSLDGHLELQLAGVLSKSDLGPIANSSFTRVLGYLPHLETIQMMREADVLFLPMQNLPPGVRSGTVPGKTYEYLASRRPIVAAIPEGDARDLLLQSGTAHVCAPDDVGGIAEALELEIARWEAGGPPPTVDEDVLGPFERRTLAAEFATLLDAVTGRSADETPQVLARISA
jgi:glycosyltransferase involved in cell wall biosynthesis